MAIIVQAIAADPYLSLYDEGIILVGAERVFRGEVPYRDFWTMYGPGQFYLGSWLFSFFGPAAPVIRLIGICSKATIASVCYLLVIRIAPQIRAVMAAFAVLMLLIMVRNDAFPMFPALAFALVAMLLVDRGVHNGRGPLFMAGACTGLAATFRHDLGAYSALGIILCFAVKPRFESRGSSNAFLELVPYAFGLLAVVIPTVVFLFASVQPADLYYSLIYSPSVIYPAVRSLPFPGLGDLPDGWRDLEKMVVFVVYLPFLVVPLVAVTEAMRWRLPPASRHSRDQSFLIAMLAITCLLFTVKGLVRVSDIHMIQSLVLSVVLMAISTVGVDPRLNRPVFVLQLLLLVPALLLIYPIRIGLRDVSVGLRQNLAGNAGVLERCLNPQLPRLQCVSSDADTVMAASFVREQSLPTDQIYVGTGRHDKLFSSTVALYFISERRPVTRWYELHPGIQTQARIQLDMIDQMRRTPPRLIVLDSRSDGVVEPNESGRSSGVTLLDNYLRDNFREIRQFGPIRVLSPR